MLPSISSLKGPAKAIGCVYSYWQLRLLCTAGLAVLRVCIYGFQGMAKPCLYFSVETSTDPRIWSEVGLRP